MLVFLMLQINMQKLGAFCFTSTVHLHAKESPLSYNLCIRLQKTIFEPPSLQKFELQESISSIFLTQPFSFPPGNMGVLISPTKELLLTSTTAAQRGLCYATEQAVVWVKEVPNGAWG